MIQNDSDWTWNNSSTLATPAIRKTRPYIISASLISIALIAVFIWQHTAQSQHNNDQTPAMTTYEGHAFGNCEFQDISGISIDWITKEEKPVAWFTAECQPISEPEPRPDSVPHVISPSGDIYDDCSLYLGGHLICNFRP